LTNSRGHEPGVDFEARTAVDAKYKAYPAQRVQENLEAAGAGMQILVLDACRNNPFRSWRGGSDGLAAMQACGAHTLHSPRRLAWLNPACGRVYLQRYKKGVPRSVNTPPRQTHYGLRCMRRTRLWKRGSERMLSYAGSALRYSQTSRCATARSSQRSAASLSSRLA
jgi:hypothetical protein